MGNRREPRLNNELPLRIFGTDADGRIFSQKVTTVNISRRGVRVSGVTVKLALDEIVGLTHGVNKSHFRVKWIGKAGTPQSGQVGLVNVNIEKQFWDLPLPALEADNFQGAVTERRKHTRIRCSTSVELHPEKGALIWGKASDLSLGGCYIEMPIPLQLESKLRVGIWIGEKKLWVTGKVTNSTPGFGFGIQFAEIPEADKQLLTSFLKTVKDERG
jgi:hypothetical protein